MNIKFLDIETDTTHSKIWLCCVDDKVFYTPDGLQEYLDSCYVVAHNGIAFDFPILKKVWGVEVPFEKQVDTLVLSRLANPAREGGHSLEAWGKVLGCEKIEHTEFDNPDIQLLEQYCLQDVKVLSKVYQQVITELKAFSDKSIKLEYEVARILAEQEAYGWQVDTLKVLGLRAQFKDETAQIANELVAMFPPIITERYSDKTGKRLKDNVEEFNPGSRQQILKRLQGLGAEFNKKTEKGNLILDEDVLAHLINTTQIEEVKQTATKVLRFLLLQKHTAMLENWLSYVDKDGAVHGYVNSIGAVTCRCTHSSPNLGQVPSKKVKYGTDMRSCFIAREGKVLVDVDLSGIELRCLAHYMNDASWTKELLEGDVHTKNQLASGLETRDQAKTFIYALLYSAGAEKIGAITGHGRKVGQKRIDDFLKATPALRVLQTKIEKALKDDKLPGLDGRKIHVRSAHSALNTLLQSAGAIVAKTWMVLVDKELKACSIEARQLGFIHDELVFECKKEDAERVKTIAVSKAREVQEILGFRCPIDAEGHIGNNWAEIH